MFRRTLIDHLKQVADIVGLNSTATLAFKDRPLRSRCCPVEADGAAAAMRALEAADGPFGAILLNMNMPGTSGLTVAEWIRHRPQCATVPILMLTSSDSRRFFRLCVGALRPRNPSMYHLADGQRSAIRHRPRPAVTGFEMMLITGIRWTFTCRLTAIRSSRTISALSVSMEFWPPGWPGSARQGEVS
jgi:CheY-like chemotaxis protein